MRSGRRGAYLGGDFHAGADASDVVSPTDGVVVEDEGGGVVETVGELVEECHGSYQNVNTTAKQSSNENLPFNPVPSSETVKCPVSELASCNRPCSCVSCFAVFEATDFDVGAR